MANTFKNIKTLGAIKSKPFIPADPYEQYTRVVLNYNGNYTDLKGSTVGNVGTTLDTTNYKFGTASAAFDNNPDYISISNAEITNLSNKSWCFETFFRITSTAVGWHCLGLHGAAGNYTTFMLLVNTGGFYVYGSQTGAAWNVQWPTSATVNLNTWYHAALCKNGANLDMYFEYNKIGTLGITASHGMNGYSMQLGYYGSGMKLIGNLDSTRMTVGHHRYSGSTISPITAEFT